VLCGARLEVLRKVDLPLLKKKSAFDGLRILFESQPIRGCFLVTAVLSASKIILAALNVSPIRLALMCLSCRRRALYHPLLGGSWLSRHAMIARVSRSISTIS
jgi:hypothetical protein